MPEPTRRDRLIYLALAPLVLAWTGFHLGWLVLHGTLWVHDHGSLVEVKVRTWNDDLPARLAAQGLQVQRTDPMSLEDIFITAVRTGAVA